MKQKLTTTTLILESAVFYYCYKNNLIATNFIQLEKFEQHDAIINDLKSEDTSIKDFIVDLNSTDTSIKDSIEEMKLDMDDVIDNKIGEIDIKIIDLESAINELESNVSTIIETKIGEFDNKIDELESNISTLIDTKIVELEEDIVSP